MNRRNFTKTSFFFSIPAVALPIGATFGQFYNKASLHALPEPIKTHLSEFKQEMYQGIQQFTSNINPAQIALNPKRILTINYKSSSNYEFTFLNQEGNKISLKAKAGKKQVIWA